jgi:hypothetical protein
MKAIVLSIEVVRRLESATNGNLKSGIEARVNKGIVQQLECFYQEIRERHKGRYPEIDRRAWTTLNSILGGVRGVPLQSVADAVGVNVEPLQVGKKRWSKWLEYNGGPACVGSSVFGGCLACDSWGVLAK